MKSFSLKSAPSRTLQLFLRPVVFGLSILAFSDIIFRFFLPIIPTNAITNTAESTVGPNTISMSNDNSVSISITPTDYQTTYRGVNELSITNSCPAGATITLTTTSDSTDEKSNNLVREGADNLTKVISPTTSTSLSSNSWGYSINGSTFYAVPTKDKTPATIYNSSSATTSPATLNVTYGVKINNQIPAGNYTNDVIYTVAVKPACLEYTIGWDMNGGTMNSTATYPTSLAYDETLNLSTLTPTRDGYTFAGWTNYYSDGSAEYVGTEAAADLNPSDGRTITMQAKWTMISYTKDFSHTGNAQTWTVPYAGKYKIELWGASGWTDECIDSCSSSSERANKSNWGIGGYGAYVAGTTTIKKNTDLYVYVGGSGNWFNGGIGNGAYPGGATDIRTVKGSTWYEDSSLRSRIIVAAGGGGGEDHGGDGGSGGGLSGYAGQRNRNSAAATGTMAGGTQTSGSHFGYSDASGTTNWGNGGGGWYAGQTAPNPLGGGGGSSYISGHTGCVAVRSKSSSSPKSNCSTGTTSNSCSISPYGYTFTNTVMVDGLGYSWTNVKGSKTNMPTTSGTGTETGHTGNGYARITYLGND